MNSSHAALEILHQATNIKFVIIGDNALTVLSPHSHKGDEHPPAADCRGKERHRGPTLTGESGRRVTHRKEHVVDMLTLLIDLFQYKISPKKKYFAKKPIFQVIENTRQHRGRQRRMLCSSQINFTLNSSFQTP